MKYDKPLVTLLAAAAGAIHSCERIKGTPIAPDCDAVVFPSIAAYEADE